MVASSFFAIGKSILGVLQQTHSELRHAKLNRLEAPLMKTVPYKIGFAAMQHKFTENAYKSGFFCIS